MGNHMRNRLKLPCPKPHGFPHGFSYGKPWGFAHDFPCGFPRGLGFMGTSQEVSNFTIIVTK